MISLCPLAASCNWSCPAGCYCCLSLAWHNRPWVWIVRLSMSGDSQCSPLLVCSTQGAPESQGLHPEEPAGDPQCSTLFSLSPDLSMKVQVGGSPEIGAPSSVICRGSPQKQGGLGHHVQYRPAHGTSYIDWSVLLCWVSYSRIQRYLIVLLEQLLAGKLACIHQHLEGNMTCIYSVCKKMKSN